MKDNFIYLNSIGCALNKKDLNFYSLSPTNEIYKDNTTPMKEMFNQNYDSRTYNSEEVFDKLSFKDFCKIVQLLIYKN